MAGFHVYLANCKTVVLTKYRVYVLLLQISAAVCFLLSPGAAYITGTCLKVDGGQSLYGTPTRVPGMWMFTSFMYHCACSIMHVQLW